MAPYDVLRSALCPAASRSAVKPGASDAEPAAGESRRLYDRSSEPAPATVNGVVAQLGKLNTADGRCRTAQLDKLSTADGRCRTAQLGKLSTADGRCRTAQLGKLVRHLPSAVLSLSS